MNKKDFEQHFWERVANGEQDECWEWTAGRFHKYGAVWWNGKTRQAHRMAWILTNGDIPSGACVLHHCDNPICCNPAHLWIGTRADNNLDKLNKGRQAKGEENGRSKLTADEVISIRSDPRSERTLAEIYGTRHTAIGMIKRRESWAWL